MEELAAQVAEKFVCWYRELRRKNRGRPTTLKLPELL
jgi:hypothetical protein